MTTPFKSDKIVFPKTRFIFLWLLLFNLGFASLYGILQPLIPFFPHAEDPIVAQILYSCSFISLCFYLIQELCQSKVNPQYIVGNLRPRYRFGSLLGLTIVFILFSIGAALVSFHVLSIFAPEFYESFMKQIAEQESQTSATPILNGCWQTFNYVAVAPITEEFIFRGVLLQRLAMKWNLPVAIWISSIIFGLLHPNPIGIAAVGVAWALLYIKTRTLIVPIIAHSINNGIVVLGDFATGWLEQDNSVSATGDEWIAGLVFIALSLPFVLMFIYRQFPNKDKTLPYFANAAKAMNQS